MKFLKKEKGFTLIELLVVVAIIGILATVVLSSLGAARTRARDARRISEMKNFQTALEAYYLDNNGYPGMAASTNNGETSGIADLESAMAPYITIDLQGKYYRDPSGDNTSRFYYRSRGSQNYQNYGIMVQLEASSLDETDGGYYDNYYELGPNPKYCMNKYTGADGNWWLGTDAADRCVGGN
jgi:prepilin-type N-terminal cleavage/methylation domain-containing protein